jgi:hypothetical protein
MSATPNQGTPTDAAIPPAHVNSLAKLRCEIEQNTGPLEQLNANGLFLLNDVCTALGMTDSQRKSVLGWRLYMVVETWQQQAVTLSEPAPALEMVAA